MGRLVPAAGSLVLEDKQLEEVGGRAALNADSLRGRGRSQPPLQLGLELGLKAGNLVLGLCQALSQLQPGQTPQSQPWPCRDDSHIWQEQPACTWTSTLRPFQLGKIVEAG